MSKSYQECFDELVSEARERVECNPHIHWDEAAREAVGDYVLLYDVETLENILENSRPNDDWQPHCSDMSDFAEVREAMALTAIRTDVLQELENEYE
jgi:hypothetical protein